MFYGVYSTLQSVTCSSVSSATSIYGRPFSGSVTAEQYQDLLRHRSEACRSSMRRRPVGNNHKATSKRQPSETHLAEKIEASGSRD